MQAAAWSSEPLLHISEVVLHYSRLIKEVISFQVTINTILNIELALTTEFIDKLWS